MQKRVLKIIACSIVFMCLVPFGTDNALAGGVRGKAKRKSPALRVTKTVHSKRSMKNLGSYPPLLRMRVSAGKKHLSSMVSHGLTQRASSSSGPKSVMIRLQPSRKSRFDFLASNESMGKDGGRIFLSTGGLLLGRKDYSFVGAVFESSPDIARLTFEKMSVKKVNGVTELLVSSLPGEAFLTKNERKEIQKRMNAEPGAGFWPSGSGTNAQIEGDKIWLSLKVKKGETRVAGRGRHEIVLEFAEEAE